MKSFSRAARCAAVLAIAITIGGQVTVTMNASAAQVTRQMVVNRAMKYLHYPYAWTGSSPKTGFSCIGFVWYVFQTLGVNMPGDLNSAMAAYPQIPERDLLPGDIVFFQNTLWKGVSHVAIYIGDGKVIHAENPHRGVNISAIQNDPVEGSYWQQHYLVAERPLGNIGVPRVSASTGSHVSVDVPSLNLRSGHSLQDTVETVLPQGTQLSQLGAWQQWVHVEMQSGLTGWVVQAGVTGVSTQGSNHRGSRHTYSVIAGVNIHNGPALQDTVISTTYSGLKVKILARQNGFIEIHTPTGITGWVEARFVNAPRPSTKGSGHHAHTGGTLSITAHIRTGPSLYAQIIRWVPAGTHVSILGRVPLWDHVRVNAHLSGYIYAEFVQTKR